MIVKFICKTLLLLIHRKLTYKLVYVAFCLLLVHVPSISVGQVSAIFYLKSTGIGSAGENWYRCITICCPTVAGRQTC